MKLGVFAKTYERSSVEEVFESAARDGISCVQFNLACSALDTLPDQPVPEAITGEILWAARRHGIEIAAVSGTFNMAHPLASMRVARPSGKSLSTSLEDLVATLTQTLSAAEATGVTLAVEPQPANIVSDALWERRLLDTFNSDRLKIVLDPANLAHLDAPNGDRARLAEAVDLLAAETILVHAKDRRADGSVCPADQGIVEFLPFLRRLQDAGYNGPLIIHGIKEEEVPPAVAHLRATLQTLSGDSSPALH